MYDYVVMLAMSEPYQIDNLFPVLFLGERKVRPEIKPFKNNICHLLKTMTGTRVSDMHIYNVNCTGKQVPNWMWFKLPGR